MSKPRNSSIPRTGCCFAIGGIPWKNGVNAVFVVKIRGFGRLVTCHASRFSQLEQAGSINLGKREKLGDSNHIELSARSGFCEALLAGPIDCVLRYVTMPQYSLSRLLTVDETAEYLGMSSKTVDRHRQSGQITFLQRERWVRIRFSDLLKDLDRWTRRASEDTGARAQAGRLTTEDLRKEKGGDELINAYDLASTLAADNEQDDKEEVAVRNRSKSRR